MCQSTRIDLLIVDDDGEFRDLLRCHFNRNGFSAQQAASGEAADGFFRQQQFDAAIIELYLPGLSGLELLEQFRASQPDCAVVILTGDSGNEIDTRSIQAGATHCLIKPCPLAEVEACVRDAVERRRLELESRVAEFLSDLQRAEESTALPAA